MERFQDRAGFRVPRVIHAHGGELVVDGSYAMTYLPGRHETARGLDIKAWYQVAPERTVPLALEAISAA